MTTRRRHRWRDYQTAAGRRPVADFIDDLSDQDAAAVAAAMEEVAVEGKRSQVLLALEGLSKKTPKTPPSAIALAERRLRDWRSRAVR